MYRWYLPNISWHRALRGGRSYQSAAAGTYSAAGKTGCTACPEGRSGGGGIEATLNTSGSVLTRDIFSATHTDRRPTLKEHQASMATCRVQSLLQASTDTDDELELSSLRGSDFTLCLAFSFSLSALALLFRILTLVLSIFPQPLHCPCL